MKKLATASLVGMVCLSFLGIATKNATAATIFTSSLNSDQEVPPVSSPGNGSAMLELSGDSGAWVLNYELTYNNLSGVIGSPFAHIHNAPRGQNGPIVHELDGADLPPIAGSSSGTIIGDWRFDDSENPLTDDLVMELMNSNLYFNLHTDLFPSGEIRGQITPQGVPEPAGLIGLICFATSLGLLRQKSVA